MTIKKINQTEFNKWGQEIEEGIFSVTRDEREADGRVEEIISLFVSSVKSKNTFALLFTIGKLDQIWASFSPSFRNEKYLFPCEDGKGEQMTHEEWGRYILQRVEEHHKTRLNKEIEDEDLGRLEEDLEKLGGVLNDKQDNKENREKLMSKIYQSDLEAYDLIWGIVNLQRQFKEITGEELFSSGEEGFGLPGEEELKDFRYFFGDLSQIILNAEEAIKNDSNKEVDKNKVRYEKKHQVDVLKAQIEELKNQKRNLEEKLASNTQLTATQRSNLNKRLNNNKKQINESEQNLNNLERELKNTDDSKKMNLAVGLGIFAAVVAVICLIIVLVRRPSHRDY